MTLRATIHVRSRGVGAHLVVPAGSTLALLGPNGSGKSTILEALAGLVTIDEGSVTHGDKTLFDSQTGVDLPSRARDVAFVSQTDSLFPSMTVADNVAFGLRSQGISRRDARREALSWLERVGADDLADRRPTSLSGGQARRVAIARALATSPSLVLLDEPFAGLDLESATAIRALVAELRGHATTVIATHDALDAHVLANAVAVLTAGRIVEHGLTADVLGQPRTTFAARMAGRVLLTGSLAEGGLKLDSGASIPVEADAIATGTRVSVAIHPRDIELAHVGLEDEVTALEPRGDLVRVHGAVLAADVEPSSAAFLRPGDTIRFRIRVKPTAYAA